MGIFWKYITFSTAANDLRKHTWEYNFSPRPLTISCALHDLWALDSDIVCGVGIKSVRERGPNGAESFISFGAYPDWAPCYHGANICSVTIAAAFSECRGGALILFQSP